MLKCPLAIDSEKIYTFVLATDAAGQARPMVRRKPRRRRRTGHANK